jgi:hypothetical protein
LVRKTWIGQKGGTWVGLWPILRTRLTMSLPLQPLSMNCCTRKWLYSKLPRLFDLVPRASSSFFLKKIYTVFTTAELWTTQPGIEQPGDITILAPQTFWKQQRQHTTMITTSRKQRVRIVTVKNLFICIRQVSVRIGCAQQFFRMVAREMNKGQLLFFSHRPLAYQLRCRNNAGTKCT